MYIIKISLSNRSCNRAVETQQQSAQTKPSDMPRSRSKSVTQRQKENRERMQTRRASETPQETENRKVADREARYDHLKDNMHTVT